MCLHFRKEAGTSMKRILKVIYGYFLGALSVVLGIDLAKKFDTYLRFHRRLSLKNPVTLADKVSHIELHNQSSLASICTDKFSVREYIARRGYADALVPLVGGYGITWVE